MTVSQEEGWSDARVVASTEYLRDYAKLHLIFCNIFRKIIDFNGIGIIHRIIIRCTKGNQVAIIDRLRTVIVKGI